MGNGVDTLRQEISAAKSEVKDDLRHESAARDSALRSIVDSALETMRRMQAENKLDTERLEKRLMGFMAALVFGAMGVVATVVTVAGYVFK